MEKVNIGSLSALLGDTDIKGELFNPNSAKSSKQRRYQELMKGINMVSHSTFERKQDCDRKFSVNKYTMNNPGSDIQLFQNEGNIDFAFGRAVETGIQATLLNHSKERIFWDMFLAWDIGLMQQHPKNYAKTFTDACIAIDQFQQIKRELMQGWEIAMFNGKPAIELALCIDLENGYYYVGHADIILFHPVLQRYRVLEIKTTGSRNVDEAMYGNSGQGVGYSVFLDNIAKGVELTATFELFYLVFPTAEGYWKLYEFTKSRSNRADWLNTVLLDVNSIDTYRRLNFWPKRGGSCYKWGRRCEYYNSCDLDPTAFNPSGSFSVITETEIDRHHFDFRFTLSQILDTQKALIK